MSLVGRTGVIGRSFPRILDGQRRCDDQHLAEASIAVGFEDHASEPRIDRQPSQAPPDGGEPRPGASGVRLQRTEFLQEAHAVGDGAAVWWIEKWEGGDVTES